MLPACIWLGVGILPSIWFFREILSYWSSQQIVWICVGVVSHPRFLLLTAHRLSNIISLIDDRPSRILHCSYLRLGLSGPLWCWIRSGLGCHLIPTAIGTFLISSYSVLILVVVFLFSSWIIRMYLVLIPLFCKTSTTSCNCARSKACFRSTKQTNIGLLYSMNFSISWRRINIASIVDLFGINPYCFPLIIILFMISCSMIFVNSFGIELNNLIPL